MVMEHAIGAVGADALASPNTAAANASAMVVEQLLPVVAAVEMQAVDEMCEAHAIPQEPAADMDITEAEVANADASLAAAAGQTLDDDEALDANVTLESPGKELAHSLGDDGAGGEKDGGGVLSFEEER